MYVCVCVSVHVGVSGEEEEEEEQVGDKESSPTASPTKASPTKGSPTRVPVPNDLPLLQGEAGPCAHCLPRSQLLASLPPRCIPALRPVLWHHVLVPVPSVPLLMRPHAFTALWQPCYSVTTRQGFSLLTIFLLIW